LLLKKKQRHDLCYTKQRTIQPLTRGSSNPHHTHDIIEQW
jgi:hypothetical protein